MNESTVAALRAAGLDPAEVARVVRTALDEDLGPSRLDVTSVATIPDGQVDTADVVARADGVVAGLAVAAQPQEEVEQRPVVPLEEDAQPGHVARLDPGHQPVVQLRILQLSRASFGHSSGENPGVGGRLHPGPVWA